MALPQLSPGSDLRRLLDGLAADHLSYLIGAGASASAGLPSWTELLRRLMKARGLHPDAADSLLARQDALLVAAAAFTPRSRLGSRHKAIFRALYRTGDTAEASRNFAPAPIHHAVAEDAVRRGKDRVKLLTLNYDDLLEEAVATQIALRNPSWTAARASDQVRGRGAAAPRAPSRFEVHHLHGLLARNRVDAQGDPLVLTLNDYNALLEDSGCWQAAQVQECLQHGPLLLVGTSYADPDIRLWLGRLKADGLGRVVALMPRQGLGLSRPDLDKVRQVLVDQWRSVGVDCVPIEDYAELTQVVRELGHVDDPGYRPPAERVAAVLTGRLNDFRAKQAADSQVLEDQVESVLEPILGVPANLTLWLHDGAEDLVRWAANDRLNRQPTQLRRVSATQESPWIAAEAMCSGSAQVRDITVSTTAADRPPEKTGRWAAVWAVTITSELAGGPPVPVGVLSAASVRPLDRVDQSAWHQAMDDLVMKWGARLAST